MNHRMNRFVAVLLLAAAAGCSSQTTTQTTNDGGRPSAEGAKYLLSTAPDGAQDVIPLREVAQDEEEVVVIGRIGGSHDPWVEDAAAFSLVDRSLAACTDIPGDKCPTPWDYCCITDKLPAATTLVKVVDDDGQLIPVDARELLGLTELQTVVVTGKAHKDETGNFTILARGIFVDPTNPGQVKREGDGHDHDHADHHSHEHDTAKNAETTSEGPRAEEVSDP